MKGYIARRLAILPIVLLGVVLISFLIVHLTPGDPARLVAGENATEDMVAAVRTRLGLDDPLIVQFWVYLRGVLSGDLGGSLMTSQPVAEEIAQSRRLCARNNWPVIDVTRRSIEETAAEIMMLLARRQAGGAVT